MKRSDHLLGWTGVAVVVASLAVVAFCLLCYESEYLWKAQELNLFLDTPLFLSQQQVVPGWLLTWAGCWFTEFFYRPLAGVAWLVAWWALLMFVTARTFSVPGRWATVLLVPVAMLLLTDVDLGYWIYYMKLRGHFFAATIGVTVAVLAVWPYRMLRAIATSGQSATAVDGVGGRVKRVRMAVARLLRLLYVPLAVAVLYPLTGFYALLAAAMMAAVEAGQLLRIKGTVKRERLAAVVIIIMAVIAIALVPQIYYRHVFCETNIEDIYRAGLPLFVYVKETAGYYTPYYIIVGFYLLLALAGGKALVKSERPAVVIIPQALLVAVLVWATWNYWYKDYNFHKELRLQQCMERQDWDGLLAEAAVQDDEPTRAIVMMRNLALFRLGRQGDEMYSYPPGAKASATPLPVSMTQVVGRSIYYNYGQLNFCYRWCLEDGVEYGWRAEYLKYLVRCALLNGEGRVARKYIDLLKHTRYHRQWAQRYERFLHGTDVDAEALRADSEFEPITHLMGYEDMLASDNTLVEKFLMTHFVNHHSDDPLYQEQTVYAALWMKDIQIFWPRFFEYARRHPDGHMPRHFQEAAYLYGHLENEVDISRMPFDEQVRRDYEEFMAMAQRFSGMSEEQMRPLMYPRFGKTFYYEYYLVRNQKLY